ncbi:hypothetical protein R3W88_029901 [Solanum pinnatisectum]|uniref:DUF4283 domain-containing protein n=1 Tax=Solanum pinnatisectum TaxID=50273 RepID=A0AAV9K6M0_9SOLN|nr:hypothetical protein R3W88_029901 [Solanum pinnatisectum]
MTRKSKTKGRGQQIQTGTQKSEMGKQGIPQTADAKKTQNVNVLQGIIPLELGSSLMENTPMRSLRGTPLGRNEGSGDTQIGKHRGFDLSTEEQVKGNIKITVEDIQEEVDYWGTTVICYVLGSNPPQSVMEGYFKWIWKTTLVIDKIAQVNREVFLARFCNEMDRGKAVEEGVQMPDIEVTKETVDKVPIWIRMVGLDIKYWGKTTLTKIAGMVGRLTFARILVEIPLHQEYLTKVRFENEVGKIIEQKIEYEWKPIMCTRCKNFGHDTTENRRQQRDTMVEKEKAPIVQSGNEKNSEEKTYAVERTEGTPNRDMTEPGKTAIANTFEVLQKEKGDQQEQATTNNRRLSASPAIINKGRENYFPHG